MAARTRSAIGRATMGMAAGTLLSRVTGFLRVAALAYALGGDRLTDAYTLANNTPNIVYDLVIGGVLSATLIPVFVDRLTRRDENEAWEAISAVVTIAGVVMVALTVVFELAAPVLIRLYAPGASQANQAELSAATSLLRTFAPQLALYGFIALATALANARRRFLAPMFSPVANNLIVTGILLAVPHVAADLSVHNLVAHRTAFMLLGWGTTAGVAAQLLVQLPSLRLGGVRLRWRWDPGHEAVRAVVRLSGWTFGFVAANQVALWIVLVLANRHGSDVTVYNYGYTFFQLPYGIVAVSVMSAIQPEMAAAWSRGDLEAFRRRLSQGLRSILAILVPAAAGYVLLAHQVVNLLIGHGHLGPQTSHLTGSVVAIFALGLPGFSAYLLFMRAYQAMQDTRTVFFLYLVENGVNVVVALALYPVAGVRGLAASLSAAYTVAAVVTAFDLRRRLGRMEGTGLAVSLVRVAASSVIMAVVVALVVAALPVTGHGLALAAQVVAAMVAGIVAYFGSATVFARRAGRPPRRLGRVRPRRSKPRPRGDRPRRPARNAGRR